MKVLAFGEILWDIIENKKYIGGAPLNFAAHYVQCGGEAAIISRVGQDTLGTSALEEVTKLKVDTSFIQIDYNHPTGTVDIVVKEGSPTYTFVKDVAFDYIKVPEEAFDDFDGFYFGTLAQRNLASRLSLAKIIERSNFKHIFYDVNLRIGHYTAELIRQSLELCTQLKMNNEEVLILSVMLFDAKFKSKQLANRIFSRYPAIELIILTDGPKGCTIYQNNESVRVPGMPIVVKDTVGAGDSFSASFFYTFLQTGDAEKSARIANQIGGFVAASTGAVPKYSDEIRKLL